VRFFVNFCDSISILSDFVLLLLGWFCFFAVSVIQFRPPMSSSAKWRDGVILWKEGTADGDRFELDASHKPNMDAISRRFQMKDMFFRRLPDLQITSHFVAGHHYLVCTPAAEDTPPTPSVKSPSASSGRSRPPSVSAASPRAFYLSNRNVYGDRMPVPSPKVLFSLG
jgi:hypothetical protein